MPGMMDRRKSAYMQITRKCNNKCVFCSNPDFDKELTLQDIKKRIALYKRKGVNEVVFSGGEPTESVYLKDAITVAKESGIEVKVITNGVNLHEKDYVKQLRDAGLRHLHVSIHAHNEEDYATLSKRKGHFDKVIQGIGNCITHGLRVDINTVINSINANYLSDLISFIIKTFPEVHHFVLNNMDIGRADTQISSRAKDNIWVVPKLASFEKELFRATQLMKKNNKTFRIERVPLCYMPGFEEYATETRQIVKEDNYICIFMEKDIQDRYVSLHDPRNERRKKAEVCKTCMLTVLCAGITKEYDQEYGDTELYPVFENPKNIISKIKNGERIHNTSRSDK